MLLSKTAIIKWSTRNYKHYIELGYNFTKFGDETEILVEHLTNGSNAKVRIKCDYCGKIFKREYKTYYNSHHNRKFITDKDSCTECANTVKKEEVLQELYGVNNMNDIPNAKERRKQTCLKKYGTEEFLSNKDVQLRIKQTNLEKYGCEYPIMNDEVKKKRANTFIERYGVTCSAKSPEIFEKIKQTNLERYGYACSLNNDEVKQKAIQTCKEKYGDNYTQVIHQKNQEAFMQKYGVKSPFEIPLIRQQILEKISSQVSSKQEDKVFEILQNIYGDKVSQSVVKYDFILDFLLLIDDNKIDIEYDGWYWHKQRLEKDKRRNYFLINKGYKVLRIRAKTQVPTSEQIIEAVNYLVEYNHSYKEINLDIN